MTCRAGRCCYRRRARPTPCSSAPRAPAPPEEAIMLAAVQDEFAAGLLDPERPVPNSIVGDTSRPPARRFAVHRNNVVVGLISALRARFPATERIVGEEFFAAMARVFIATRPPRSPLLMFYGDDFPQFVASFPPAAALVYLPDV